MKTHEVRTRTSACPSDPRHIDPIGRPPQRGGKVQARHLDRARRTAFAERGLETWEFDVLSALRRTGTPYQLSPGQLVTQTLVTPGIMTNRIDRLAAQGLVVRGPDPNDRRGVLVRLTDSGREFSSCFAAK